MAPDSITLPPKVSDGERLDRAAKRLQWARVSIAATQADLHASGEPRLAERAERLAAAVAEIEQAAHARRAAVP